ncbi:MULTISPECIES: hypothetical protein [unclassified Streptomyces]|uniref:hypothetical protein n=1 Tax=unclassified Streptomyces TaxID=2593676 RepID=UPI0022714F82|nr:MULTISPECIES: hypothetical protein [unclassified Streptomyces]MCY0919609.1 hypothetical protein [Streptomyces sp. H27-G5]MCY0957209.1 hypothetical protein [Streptomyces sp. H27-H5]
MAAATDAELRAWLRLPDALTEDESATADLLIELAQGVIEEEAGQALESSTDTVVLDGPTRDGSAYQSASRSDRLILPRWPVTAVHTVTEDGTDLTHGTSGGYTWSAAGILTRRGATWPSHDQAVEVVYTAGFLLWPPGLKRIVLRLAAAGWSNPEMLASESLGDHSRSFVAEALGMELTKADLRTVSAYKART